MSALGLGVGEEFWDIGGEGDGECRRMREAGGKEEGKGKGEESNGQGRVEMRALERCGYFAPHPTPRIA